MFAKTTVCELPLHSQFSEVCVSVSLNVCFSIKAPICLFKVRKSEVVETQRLEGRVILRVNLQDVFKGASCDCTLTLWSVLWTNNLYHTYQLATRKVDLTIKPEFISVSFILKFMLHTKWRGPAPLLTTVNWLVTSRHLVFVWNMSYNWSLNYYLLEGR